LLVTVVMWEQLPYQQIAVPRAPCPVPRDVSVIVSANRCVPKSKEYSNLEIIYLERASGLTITIGKHTNLFHLTVSAVDKSVLKKQESTNIKLTAGTLPVSLTSNLYLGTFHPFTGHEGP